MAHHRKGRSVVPNPTPGSSPGVIRAVPGSPAPVITAICYGPENHETIDISDARQLEELRGKWPVVWVNVDGLGDADVIVEIGRVFGLHPLALEDVVNIGQRTKSEPYEDHVFIIIHMTRPGERTGEQVSLFLGDGFVISFQLSAGDCFDQVRDRIRSGRPRIRKSGADYLTYALLDSVIDAYFPSVEGIDARLDRVETLVYSDPDERLVTDLQEIKKEIREIRRIAGPHREALGFLIHEESGLIKPETRVFLRDCADHAARVMELLDSSREHALDLTNAYISMLGHRQNEVMKVLTIMAAIFIPLSFIAGVYGMNFDPGVSPWNMPELGWAWGYPAALTLMAVVAVGLLLVFRRKGWFG